VSGAIPIFVLDDDPGSRAGFHAMAAAVPRGVVAGAAAHDRAGWEALRAAAPRVVIDVSAGELESYPATLELLHSDESLAATGLLIVTPGPASHWKALEALQSGASGYLTREETDQARFAQAVGDIAAGGAVLSPLALAAVLARVARFVAAVPDDLDERVALLTRREREVLSLLALGRTNAVIGGLLGVSPGTVKTHLQSVFTKLRVPGRLEAAQIALYLDDPLLPARRGARRTVPPRTVPPRTVPPRPGPCPSGPRTAPPPRASKTTTTPGTSGALRHG